MSWNEISVQSANARWTEQNKVDIT